MKEERTGMNESKSTRVGRLPSKETIDFAKDTGTEMLIRQRHVEELTGLAKPTINKLRRQGDFPEPVKITKGVSAAVAWRLTDIQQWIASRPPAGQRS